MSFWLSLYLYESLARNAREDDNMPNPKPIVSFQYNAFNVTKVHKNKVIANSLFQLNICVLLYA